YSSVGRRYRRESSRSQPQRRTHSALGGSSPPHVPCGHVVTSPTSRLLGAGLASATPAFAHASSNPGRATRAARARTPSPGEVVASGDYVLFSTTVSGDLRSTGWI